MHKVAEDELRLKVHDVRLSNQEIVEFGYLVKETLEPLIQNEVKIKALEHLNCIRHCFQALQEILAVVDANYLEMHSELAEFYQNNRKLGVMPCDILFWKRA